MKTLLAAVLCACLASSSTVCHAELTEIGVAQFLSVETVTCTMYFIHYDFQYYGEVTGSGCTSTAPLPPQSTSSQGHVTVSFDFGHGNVWSVKGCRVDSAVGTPGYYRYSVNCT